MIFIIRRDMPLPYRLELEVLEVWKTNGSDF